MSTTSVLSWLTCNQFRNKRETHHTYYTMSTKPPFVPNSLAWTVPTETSRGSSSSSSSHHQAVVRYRLDPINLRRDVADVLDALFPDISKKLVESGTCAKGFKREDLKAWMLRPPAVDEATRKALVGARAEDSKRQWTRRVLRALLFGCAIARNAVVKVAHALRASFGDVAYDDFLSSTRLDVVWQLLLSEDAEVPDDESIVRLVTYMKELSEPFLDCRPGAFSEIAESFAALDWCVLPNVRAVREEYVEHRGRIRGEGFPFMPPVDFDRFTLSKEAVKVTWGKRENVKPTLAETYRGAVRPSDAHDEEGNCTVLHITTHAGLLQLVVTPALRLPRESERGRPTRDLVLLFDRVNAYAFQLQWPPKDLADPRRSYQLGLINRYERAVPPPLNGTLSPYWEVTKWKDDWHASHTYGTSRPRRWSRRRGPTGSGDR